ncbi:DUF2502 domain-containing protein [Ewingella americana]|uniref:DUF2502 domain-containing protein n=1 Tax=Ewingella americana TaxID=41202 RepID=A0A502GMZ0_9GAMM|nr:DUF2502 domain-containing protein [Ewingella americana]TPG62660.1 DUF2502 domain-containing protein [Ewingella americana]
MKKSLLLLCCVLALPVVAQAGVTVDVNVPGVSVHLGDQDQRGYYWDGYDWRPPQWWRGHQGNHVGERNDRGMYWRGDRWQPSPPPRPPHNRGHEQPHQNSHRDDQHHDNNGHQGGNNKHQGGNNDHQGNGQPIPPDGQRH